MILIYVVDTVVVLALVFLTLTRGFERTLPFFAFLMILIPGESQIPLLGFFDLTTQRIATVTLAALYLALGNRGGEALGNRKAPLRSLLLVYVSWCVLSSLNSIVPIISMKTVFSLALDFYLVYFIFSKSISNVESVHRILSALVAALVICCVFGWLEVYAHWKVIELFPKVTYRFSFLAEHSGPSGRIRSTFPHSILFGNALALGIPIGFYLLSIVKKTWHKWYLWIALIMMFWNLYKTMSRGPWLAIGTSLVLLFVFSHGNTRKRLFVIFALMVLVLIIRPGVWDTIKNTYWGTFDPNSPRATSYQYRYELMRVARERLAKDFSRTIWGFGPGSFYDLHLETEFYGRMVPAETGDSAIVQIATDTGYVGLFLVTLLLMMPALVSLRRFTRMPPPSNFLCLVFLINLVAFGFLMFSVMNFGWGQQTHMLWILLALSMVYPRLVQSESEAREALRLPWGEARREIAKATTF